MSLTTAQCLTGWFHCKQQQSPNSSFHQHECYHYYYSRTSRACFTSINWLIRAFLTGEIQLESQDRWTLGVKKKFWTQVNTMVLTALSGQHRGTALSFCRQHIVTQGQSILQAKDGHGRSLLSVLCVHFVHHSAHHRSTYNDGPNGTVSLKTAGAV